MKLDYSAARAELEAIYAEQTNQSFTQRDRAVHTGWMQGFRAKLSVLGAATLKFLVGSNEPTITQKSDRQGNPYFEVYDPFTDSRAFFSSEREVRAWLEERYSR